MSILGVYRFRCLGRRPQDLKIEARKLTANAESVSTVESRLPRFLSRLGIDLSGSRQWWSGPRASSYPPSQRQALESGSDGMSSRVRATSWPHDNKQFSLILQSCLAEGYSRL